MFGDVYIDDFVDDADLIENFALQPPKKENVRIDTSNVSTPDDNTDYNDNMFDIQPFTNPVKTGFAPNIKSSPVIGGSMQMTLPNFGVSMPNPADLAPQITSDTSNILNNALGSLVPGGEIIGGILNNLFSGSPVSKFNRHGRGFLNTASKRIFEMYKTQPAKMLTEYDKVMKFIQKRYSVALSGRKVTKNARQGINEGLKMIDQFKPSFQQIVNSLKANYNITTQNVTESVNVSNYPSIESSATETVTYNKYILTPKSSQNQNVFENTYNQKGKVVLKGNLLKWLIAPILLIIGIIIYKRK